MSTFLGITLNARLAPLDRGEYFEDPLMEILDVRTQGSGVTISVTGGGTLLTAEHEPEECDIDVDLDGDVEAGLSLVIEALEILGAPKGSRARLEGRDPVVFGVADGLGLYLNGTDLADEVYAQHSADELIALLHEALGEHGRMLSYWQGPRETALYFYGPSAVEMRSRIDPVLAANPLGERSRLVAIT